MCSLILESFFTWSIQPATEAELKLADVILAQSFGYRTDGPGLSNIALATIVDQLRKRLHIPVIAQHEIADCLVEPPLTTIREHRKSGEYLDTFEVVDQSYAACVSHAFTNPIIVAHPHHQWRVMRVVEGFGIFPVAADVSSVPYDTQSAQRWTRNKALFVLREIPSRLLYLKKGYV